MAVQVVPFALQNASHSAAVFRQAMSAPYLTGGALGNGELLVTQQSTPNMSVRLFAGRAKVTGSSVSPPAGQTWTTQAMYDVLNDTTMTLTIAASNPTNPRIDLVYIQVQDSFYSGANNQAIAGVVTGTPAASPVVPATPLNAIAIATVAVGAGVTTILNANIARVVTSAALLGGVLPTASATTLAALQTAGTLDRGTIVAVLSTSSEWFWNGTVFILDNIPRVANGTTRDALFVAPVIPLGGATVFRVDQNMLQTYDGTVWRWQQPGLVTVIPSSVAGATLGPGGVITFSAAANISVNGLTNEFDNYKIVMDLTGSALITATLRLRAAGVNDTSANYDSSNDYGTGVTPGSAFTSAGSTWTITVAGHTYVRGEWILEQLALAKPTSLRGAHGEFEIPFSNNRAVNDMNVHRLSTAYDGFSFIITGGTATGTMRIYGYNNN